MARADKTIQYESIHPEYNNELIGTTLEKFKLFMANGKLGIDAFLVYSHLQFTAQIQKTNSVWAKDTYIMAGLKMSRPRLQRAKGLLHRLSLISYRKARDEKGVFTGWFITVHASRAVLSSHPQGTFTSAMDSHYTGCGQQMLVLETKCFNEKPKCFNEEPIAEESTSLQLAPPIPSANTTPIVKKKDVTRKSTDSTDFAAAEQLFYPPDAEYKITFKQRSALREILKLYPLADVSTTLTRFTEAKASNDSFWRKQPIIPTVVLSMWERINESRKAYKTLEEMYGPAKDEFDWCR